MTEPMGQCFISYARRDAAEVDVLASALRRRGLSPWIDRTHLGSGSTADVIRALIDDRQAITSGIAWLSRNVVGRPMIQTIEIPALFSRADDDDDPFFLVPIVRPPMEYDEAAEAAGRLTNSRNFIRPEGDEETVAREAAAAVLHEHLRRLHRRLPAGDPVEIAMRVRRNGPANPSVALQMAWAGDFTEARGRVATPETWTGLLLPAVWDVADAIIEHAPGRPIQVDGAACSVPAATAFGSAFPEQQAIDVRWRPDPYDQDQEPWRLSLSDGSEPLSVSIRTADIDQGTDVAVVLSITNDARPAFAAMRSDLPPLRTIVEIKGRHGIPTWFDSGIPAAAGARQVAKAMRQARLRDSPTGAFHLFMAVPFGLAMMVGQQLATLGPVHVHEFVADSAPGSYRNGPVLLPT